jgi:hypothetical protein
MRRHATPALALLLGFCVTSHARADVAAIATAPPPADAAEAARQAAEAARQAAEAARASADAVRALTDYVKRQEGVPAEGPELPPWSYQLGFSAIANAGNSSAFNGKTTLAVDGHWRDWGTELRATGAYGQSQGADSVDPPETTAFNGAASLKGIRNYTPLLGSYVQVGAATDHVASIEYQLTGEVGISLMWWEVQRQDYVQSRLRTSIGFRALRERRFTYYPTSAEVPDSLRLLYGPPVSLNFRYALSKTAFVTEDAEIVYAVNNTKDLRATSNTALNVQLTDGLALQVAYKVRYIGSPAAGKRTTDTELSTGLAWTW